MSKSGEMVDRDKREVIREGHGGKGEGEREGDEEVMEEVWGRKK